MYNNIHFLGT